MRKQVRRRHEAHVRAESVCTEHSAFFDATPGGQKAHADHGKQVAEVGRLLALQHRSNLDRRDATEQSRLSRRALRNAVRAVIRVGRIVNLDAEVMGNMRLPGRKNNEELLTFSQGLLERVSPHAAAFVAEGLPPELLKHLDQGIADFAAAREAQARSRQRFTAASESIDETLDRADKTADVLEDILITTPGASPEALVELRLARRVGPRVTPPEPTTPQVTPTPKAA